MQSRDGPNAWEYRSREIQTDGTRKGRAITVGSVEEYPTESDAQTAAVRLCLNINDPTRRVSNKEITVKALINHYSEHELPDIFHKDGPVAETTSLREQCSPAKGSKAKIRNIMSALYSHAIRWGWTTTNPIKSVRQSAKRQKIPEILTVDELLKLTRTVSKGM